MKTHRPKTAPRIFLLTVPHTGTYTTMYALAHLGCLPVWWSHFEPRALPALELLHKHRRENDIILTTFRGTEETKESFANRGKDVGYAEQCIAMRDEWLPRIHEGCDLLTFNYHKGAAECYRNQAIYALFTLLDEPMPSPLLDYMKEWSPKNSYKQDENRGLTPRELRRLQDILNKLRITDEVLSCTNSNGRYRFSYSPP